MPNTDKPYNNSDPAVITDEVSPESKNTLTSQSNNERGRQAELTVIAYFEKRGAILLNHRLKTPFAEVDVVVRQKNGLVLLIEVKTLTNFNFLNQRVQSKQKIRLLRARSWYEENFGHCCLLLAVVNKQKEVLVLEDVFG